MEQRNTATKTPASRIAYDDVRAGMTLEVVGRRHRHGVNLYTGTFKVTKVESVPGIGVVIEAINKTGKTYNIFQEEGSIVAEVSGTVVANIPTYYEDAGLFEVTE